MDAFAQRSNEDRLAFFEEVTDQIGLITEFVEKDFWVCWILRQLFLLEDVGKYLTFKGGTSLSKVYNVISRFSEDVDISIERDYFGYGGDQEPEKACSKKERRRRVEGLRRACQEAIREIILPGLENSIMKVISDTSTWRLFLDPDDSDQQTILFQYPSVFRAQGIPYLKPVVKIELGARSDNWPVEQAQVISYVAKYIESVIGDRTIAVRVLSAERTFWEKATILHMLHHQPDHRVTPVRVSRHYYDTYQISLTPILQRAIDQLELLHRVAEHKSIFFSAGWARYEDAKPGTLRLAPKPERIQSLEKDYQKMREMFFVAPPEFDKVISTLKGLEERINLISGPAG